MEGGPTLIFLLLLGVIIYFLPLFVALGGKHRNAVAIFLLNLFLGWSLIGWLAALVWAVAGAENKAAGMPTRAAPGRAPTVPRR